ncbi:MAG: GWxTD domain-containing protein [Candidatus Angelobacter sp.]
MISVSNQIRHFFIILAVIMCGSFLVQAQESSAQNQQAPEQKDSSSGKKKSTQAKDSDQSVQGGEEDPLKRPRPETKGATIEKLGGVYKKWLDEDVRWIITDEELSAFKKLTTNAERDQFIEQFWLRRDPTPDTAENEYKEDHYRRIAYANEHFAAGIPGWKTDR